MDENSGDAVIKSIVSSRLIRRTQERGVIVVEDIFPPRIISSSAPVFCGSSPLVLNLRPVVFYNSPIARVGIV